MIPGNGALHTLTSGRAYRLLVDITRPDGQGQSAQYSVFRVGPAASQYRLTVGGYTGTAGEGAVPPSSGRLILRTTNQPLFWRFEAKVKSEGIFAPSESTYF